MYSALDSVRPHFEALARVAYYKLLVNTVTPFKQTLHKCYRIGLWAIVLIYNLQHILRAYQCFKIRTLFVGLTTLIQSVPGILFIHSTPVILVIILPVTVVPVRHNTDQLVDTLFILLTTLNALGKQVAFNVRGRRIDNIIEIINGEIFAAKNIHHETLMKRNARTMSHVLKLYQCAGMFCGLLWIIYPIINRALGEQVELTGYVPFDTSTSPEFELTVIVMGIVITVQAYGNVTMDCTIVAFYTQAQTQFKILRYNMENLMNLDRRTHCFKNNSDATMKGTIYSRFVDSVKHYEQIVWFFKDVESIFAEAMIVQFLVMVWVICMTLYKIVALDFLSLEFISIGMYLGCMLAQLFIYCYYGTQLKYESEQLVNSLYNADWLNLSPSFRRLLLIFMERCNRPIEPRTAYVIPHSLDTYISVLRSSYALFTFLDKKSK